LELFLYFIDTTATIMVCENIDVEFS
jgi:hypothetical protein